MTGPDSQEAFDRLAVAATTTRDLAEHSGVTRWEVFCKASAVRDMVFTPDLPLEVSLARETGVAIRVVERGRTGFGAAAGLDTDAARSAVESALASQTPLPVDPLPPPRLLDRTETATRAAAIPTGWATHTVEELTGGLAESADGRLQVRRLVLRQGTYGWLLTTGDGFVTHHRGGGVSMELQLAFRDAATRRREWVWVADPETFDPRAAASHMADRLLLEGQEPAPRDGLADLLLHPEVSAHVLAAVAPLFVTRPAGADPLPRLLDRDGRLASAAVSLVDDRVSEDGPAAGPCDGEGLPARRTVLLDRGIPRHRVASYLDAQLNGDPPCGGARRISYRDYPATGFGGLRLTSDFATPASRLLSSDDRTIYLLRPLAPVHADPDRDELRIVASGVWLDRGRICGSHPVAEIRAGLAQFLRRIEGVGADGSWFETAAGFVEGPTLLIRCQRVVA